MEVKPGPNPVDEPTLLYKLQRKIKVFNTNNPLPNRGYNLVASSSKYGLVFIASPSKTISAYYLKDIINKDCEPKHVTVQLPIQPTHVAVNCDQEWLAVTGDQMLIVYKCQDFQNQGVGPAASIKCDVNPSTFISALQWNPCIPDTIGLVYFDGTLITCQVSTMQVKKIQSNAKCLCWSPKGKQFVTGNNDGTLTQYKPDLTQMKVVPAPNLFQGAPVEVLAIYWIATYQFAVTYRNASNDSRPAVAIVNTPKGSAMSCINYEDVCYSMGSNRPWYYYLFGIPQWNLILTASSNSMEVATLASVDGSNWLQFCQSDDARPELPLTNKKIENYPVGVSIDTCAIHQLPWGENEQLPPMPLLHVVSHTGLLTVFNVVNLGKSAAQLCAPPQHIALPQLAMTSQIPDDAPPAPEPAQQQAPPKPQPTQQIVQPQPVQAQQPQPFQPQPVQAQPQSFKPQQLPQPQQPSFSSSFASAQASQTIVKPAPKTEPTVLSVPKPSTPATDSLKPPAIQSPSAAEAQALKAEQIKINKAKALEELKKMLIKEVNDFQMELYQFRKETVDKLCQIQNDIQTANVPDLHHLSTEQLQKDCSIEELHESVVQLKLELVRACAVVAEARTHAQAKDEEWTQEDPLTAKRIASVKKLAYYVQSQLDQARRALDHKWNEMAMKDEYRKPGDRMIRPILDDVYQPLVKQQEILTRQEAVLRTLRATLKECDISPMFKTTSILRSTPFKKDPLSKLTKNILNMSIEPQTKPKELLSSQKLDALRDMLSNHTPNKIKPVHVDLRKHVENMKKRYEKSLKEKEELKDFKPVPVKVEPCLTQVEVKMPQPKPAQSAFELKPQAKPPMPSMPQAKPQVAPSIPQAQPFIPQMPIKVEAKPDKPKESPITIPTFTPVNAKTVKNTGLVARTLFTDEPKQEPVVPTLVFGQQTNKSPFAPAEPPKSTPAQPSVLHSVLTSDTKSFAQVKNTENTFMGQKICAPTAFSFSKQPPTNTFTAKPISDNSIFSKFSAPQPKPEEPKATDKQKSDETGEQEATVVIKQNVPFRPTSNIFNVPTSPPANSQKSTPDIQKSFQGFGFTQVDNKKTQDKESENAKENIQEKKEAPLESKKENENAKEINKPPVNQTVIVVDLKKKTDGPAEKPVATVFSASSTAPVSSSKPQAIAVQPKVIFGSTVIAPAKEKTPDSATPATKSETETKTTSSESDTKATVPATSTSTSLTIKPATQTTQASAFVSIQPANTDAKSDASTPSTPSVFAPTSKPTSPVFATTTSASSIFASANASNFGTTTTQSSVFGTQSTTQSAFGQTTTTSSVFGATSSAQSIFSAAATNTFGSTPANTQSVFGTATTTTQSSVFGSTPASVFGSANQTSVFGSPTTQASIFGSPTTQASVFGSPTQTTQSSVFGTPTQTTQASVFGTPTQTTQASVFGSTPSQGSVFGAQTTQSGSVFGSPATTQSGSIFGGAESNLFAAASISTTSASSPTSGGSIFGGGSSVFGSSGGNVFGGKASFSGSNPTAANIFGGFNQGQKPAADFWSGGNANSGSGFGTPAFGQQATTQASSIFGGTTGGSFSAPGGQFGSPGPFSGGENKSVFGTPQQQTGAPAFGGSPVFGSSPVFGGKPSFGSPGFGGAGATGTGAFNKSPGGFGAAPAFGGGATFGTPAFGGASPGKVFGSSSPGFGSPSQQSAPVFENLATQNTLTFGNLAQQSGPAPQSAPSFNTSPSFTGWRG
ncbi:nuclear pore complex protein Nup214 isoform X2 [Aricia agestis]|uniref:nuclear pore complex protein Nup214 isoform X2 n=1 Tax=Aricia agestis TaxID=91739 RepID=UPI001C20BEAB|nr:nuclear pore complex protein Nup214 isoform X2 [Aricia agestis]